jgi:hypothetical protein
MQREIHKLNLGLIALSTAGFLSLRNKSKQERQNKPIKADKSKIMYCIYTIKNKKNSTVDFPWVFLLLSSSSLRLLHPSNLARLKTRLGAATILSYDHNRAKIQMQVWAKVNFPCCACNNYENSRCQKLWP